MTDIEGNGDKFKRILSSCAAICLEGPDSSPSLRFRESAPANSQFVYGGDVGDKGAFSLRLLRLLVNLKRREPSRVHLIVGNREAKMTRILDELGQGGSRGRLAAAPAVFWNLQRPPIAFVAEEMQKRKLLMSVHEYLGSLTDEECDVLYLRWMLIDTMGCGPVKRCGSVDTFQLLREEVAALEGVPVGDMSDFHVLKALKSELGSGGAYYEYLSRGVLMHRIGDTLFLHGAVTDRNVGTVPGQNGPVENLDEWIFVLNQWYHNQIVRWKRGLTALHSESSHPGDSDLMHYMVQNPQSVVTTNWYSRDRTIGPLPDVVAQYLVRAGVRRVVTGHQPFSDFPLILRHGSGVHVVVGDTSFSDPSDPHNNQGGAYHTLEIRDINGTTGSYWETEAVIGAIRRNGNKQEVIISAKRSPDIGRVVDGGVLRINEDDGWVVSQLDGFNVVDKPVLYPIAGTDIQADNAPKPV